LKLYWQVFIFLTSELWSSISRFFDQKKGKKSIFSANCANTNGNFQNKKGSICGQKTPSLRLHIRKKLHFICIQTYGLTYGLISKTYGLILVQLRILCVLEWENILQMQYISYNSFGDYCTKKVISFLEYFFLFLSCKFYEFLIRVRIIFSAVSILNHKFSLTINFSLKFEENSYFLPNWYY